MNAASIAHWDAVPYQQYDGSPLRIIADHINGIAEVCVDGAKVERVNDFEHLVTAEPHDGEFALRAEVIPNDGASRIIDLPLFGAWKPQVVTVGRRGDYQNIWDAMNAVPEGGEVVIIDEGEYPMNGGGIRYNAPIQRSRHIVTIRGADGLNPDNIVLTSRTRGSATINAGRVRLQNLSICFDDLTNLRLNHGATPRVLWLDRVRWFGTKGTDGWYGYLNYLFHADIVCATDCRAHDVIHGCNSMHLARGNHLERIYGDCFMNTRFAVSNKVRDFRAKDNAWHSDLIQYFGHPVDNAMVYDPDAEGSHIQGLFFDWRANQGIRYDNMAFVNMRICDIRAEPGHALSQISGICNHIVMRNVTHTGLSLIFRDDATSQRQPFTPSNFLIEDSTFSRITGTGWDGITFRNVRVPDDGTPIATSGIPGVLVGVQDEKPQKDDLATIIGELRGLLARLEKI